MAHDPFAGTGYCRRPGRTKVTEVAIRTFINQLLNQLNQQTGSLLGLACMVEECPETIIQGVLGAVAPEQRKPCSSRQEVHSRS